MVTRQKDECQNGGNNKIKRVKFSDKHFVSPDSLTYVCVSEGKKCLFLGKFGMLCFIVPSVFEIRLFALLLTI